MHAALTARKPAPMAARGVLGVRRCVRPNAFGNALGEGFADILRNTRNPSSYAYENEMDRQSDAAYRARQALAGRLTIEYAQAEQDEYILAAAASGIVTLSSNANGGRLIARLGPISDALDMKSMDVKHLVTKILDIDQCQISARRIRSSGTYVLWVIRIR